MIRLRQDTPEGYRYRDAATGHRGTATAACNRKPHPRPRRPRQSKSARSPSASSLRSEHLAAAAVRRLLKATWTFNLFGTGTQFNGFFGGSGQGSWPSPRLMPGRGGTGRPRGRSRPPTTIVRSSRDSERYILDIRQRPAQAAVWLLRPLGARRRPRRVPTGTTFGSRRERRRTIASRAAQPERARAAPRPRSAAQRVAGFIWGSYARRSLAPVGLGVRCRRRVLHDVLRGRGRDVRAPGAKCSLAASPLVCRGASKRPVMGGDGLDRFSRCAWQFRQPPARVSGGARPLRPWRHAAHRRSHDGGTRRAPRWLRRHRGRARSRLRSRVAQLHRVRRRAQAPVPFRTLLSIEWGYGLQGIDTQGRRGTSVVRISTYKVFGTPRREKK